MGRWWVSGEDAVVELAVGGNVGGLPLAETVDAEFHIDYAGGSGNGLGGEDTVVAGGYRFIAERNVGGTLDNKVGDVEILGLGCQCKETKREEYERK